MDTNQNFRADVHMEFIGEVHPHFRKFVEETEGLNNITSYAGNVPHKELIKMYGSSSVLLMVLTGYKDAEGFLPGKLFEYFATGLPILAVGPVSGDAAKLLQETGSGVMLESNDQAGIQKTLRDLYTKWQRLPQPDVNPVKAPRFSRKEITGQLVNILSMR